MTDSSQRASPSNTAPRVGSVSNIGEPLRLKNVEPLAGFSAQAGKPGQQMKVWTRLALTSDDPLFHRLAENLSGVINHMAQSNGLGANLSRADVALLVLKPDATAELWLDTAAVSLRCLVKRAVVAGTAIFERDIADITGMTFPCVTFGERDKVLCIFRQDWRFGLAFDMNPESKLEVDAFVTTLGTLYRKLRYKHLYEALDNPQVSAQLLAAGWVPFVEIITGEFKDLLDHCHSGFDLADLDEKIIKSFDAARLQRMKERWVAKAHFSAKANLLDEAIKAFSTGQPIAVIKIVLTEIEGILNDAHRAANNGQGAKVKQLLEFAVSAAVRKAGGPNTLLLPEAFGEYLRNHTFANFYPVLRTGTAGSRHAVGHGAAAQDSYTMTRALQALLTLDQLAFYT